MLNNKRKGWQNDPKTYGRDKNCVQFGVVTCEKIKSNVENYPCRFCSRIHYFGIYDFFKRKKSAPRKAPRRKARR